MNTRRASSGQAIILAVFIVVLLMVSVPTIILLNQSASRGQVAGLRSVKSGAMAVSGIMHATQQLAEPSVWERALRGDFSGTDCNTTTGLSMPSGAHILLSCTQTGRPYQVSVTATANASNATAINRDQRSVQAFLSQRTVGVKLSTDYSASAALLLVNTPVNDPINFRPITVHWGPVVCLSSGTLPAWVLYDPMNSVTLTNGRLRGFPRKFSLGGVTGFGSAVGDLFNRVPDWTVTSVRSDDKEFWSYAPMTFMPRIDDARYETLSKTTNPGPQVNGRLSDMSVRSPDVANTGFYDIGGDTITFDSTFQPLSGSYLYVKGNVILKSAQVDLSTGALVVTGLVTLDQTVGGDGIAGMTLEVPPSAPLEYPYYTSMDGWPCQSHVGGTCSTNELDAATLFGTNGHVHFRGFLWAQGSLVVNSTWHMAGVVVAGNPSTGTGNMSVQAGGAMILAYDDKINRSLQMSSLELQVDSMRNVAAP